MLKLFALAAMTVVLCGCSTTSPAQRMAQNQSTCSGYGFKPNSDAYSTCMMQLDLDAKQEDRDRMHRIGQALSQVGRDMQPRRPVTCNTFGNARSTGYGTYGNSTTTCY